MTTVLFFFRSKPGGKRKRMAAANSGELPPGTMYLGCIGQPPPEGRGGEQWAALGRASTASTCIQRAQEHGYAAVALRGFDPADGTSECLARVVPWKPRETATAGSATEHACAVVGSVALGGGEGSYALYSAPPSSASGRPPPPPPSQRPTAIDPDAHTLATSCAASVVRRANPCFTDANGAGWVLHRAQWMQPGAMWLQSGGSVSQDIPTDAGWQSGRTYRLEATIRRPTLDLGTTQRVHAYLVHQHDPGAVTSLGRLDVHNQIPETKRFPVAFACPNHPVRLVLEHVCDPTTSTADQGTPHRGEWALRPTSCCATCRCGSSRAAAAVWCDNPPLFFCGHTTMVEVVLYGRRGCDACHAALVCLAEANIICETVDVGRCRHCLREMRTRLGRAPDDASTPDQGGKKKENLFFTARRLRAPGLDDGPPCLVHRQHRRRPTFVDDGPPPGP